VAALFDAAVREAKAAFGRGECFLEAYVERGRHVEAQVLADAYGSVLVAGTRDCTLQRRYQKLVEEAPAPFLSDAQRSLLERSAAAICREACYVSAGTVEFLLSPAGELSFLEVNTRLQVEHSATEETIDVDLVRAQLLIAAGHRLAEATGGPVLSAAGPGGGYGYIEPRRHAIEFRVNAEDPDRGFSPSTGTITGFRPPGGPGVRVDSGVEAGSVVGGQFDSLLAKVIITGRDRGQAIERARRALSEFEITGVRTTLPFLRAVLTEPAFTADGPDGFAVHTSWIEQDYLPAAASAGSSPAVGQQDGQQDGRVAIRVGRRWLGVEVPGLTQAREGPLLLARQQAAERLERAGQAAGDAIRAPMQGTVIRVEVTDGDAVTAGQLLAVIEAMKMENPLRAPHSGRVAGLHVAVGDTVAQGALLCQVTPPEPAEPA
jgi:acetyl-CoA/propionyl-CoA carboxylase biotin carboxyl carrier protein